MEVIRIYERLLNWYGPPGWWPLLKPDGSGVMYDPAFSSREKNDSEKLEIALGAILTQNTSWSNVVGCLVELKKRGWMDAGQLLRLTPVQLAESIRSSGYYNQKALKILAYIHAGRPATRGALLKVWGVGEETADSILLYAYNQPWMVVDAYTRRIFTRLDPGLGCLKHYADWQDRLTRHLPEAFIVMNQFHALLVNLGKSFCMKKAPDCVECPLRSDCQSGSSPAG